MRVLRSCLIAPSPSSSATTSTSPATPLLRQRHTRSDRVGPCAWLSSGYANRASILALRSTFLSAAAQPARAFAAGAPAQKNLREGGQRHCCPVLAASPRSVAVSGVPGLPHAETLTPSTIMAASSASSEGPHILAIIHLDEFDWSLEDQMSALANAAGETKASKLYLALTGAVSMHKTAGGNVC